MRASSPRVLDAAQLLRSMPSSGCEVEVARRGRSTAAWVRWSASASTGPSAGRGDEQLAELRPRRGPTTTSRVDAGGGEVGGGPLGVAPVGDERGALGRDDDPAERAAEAGQPADVRRRSRRAAWRRRARGPHGVGPRRRSRSAGSSAITPGSPSRWATARGGELVAVPPKPTIEPVATGRDRRSCGATARGRWGWTGAARRPGRRTRRGRRGCSTRSG